jgi:hypothetical protein
VRDAYRRLVAQGWTDALRALHPATSEVGGSYIRILRSDSAVFGGRQFVTLIFGEERRSSLIPGSV